MTSWAALAIAASLVARGVRWPDQRLIAIDADPELLGQRHCSRWFRGLVTIPGGEYIYSASTQRLRTRMYTLYETYGSPNVRRALPIVQLYAHIQAHTRAAPVRVSSVRNCTPHGRCDPFASLASKPRTTDAFYHTPKMGTVRMSSSGSPHSL